MKLCSGFRPGSGSISATVQEPCSTTWSSGSAFLCLFLRCILTELITIDITHDDIRARPSSPALVVLDKQKVLLAEYKSHLVLLRNGGCEPIRGPWKKLLVRLGTVVLIIGRLTGAGEISRGLALHNVQDPNRHLIMSMVHRVVTLISITVVALFGASSDLKSLATYFGLLTAGMAVALQNVIVASLGYLLLIGKRGIKIGDRVQVAAITGDVIDMGLLQFLREFDVLKQQFTGQVATFSNSLVFVSPANGLLKFNSAAEKVAHTVADRTGIG